MSKEKKEPIDKLENALGIIDKNFGSGSVIKMDDYKVLDREVLKTGSLGLDIALGGGVVRGRIIEIFGPESSGKTTLAIHMMAEAQKYGNVLFVDCEHSFDANYAQNLGVSLDKLYMSQPESSEQIFEIMEALTATEKFSMVVLDSVAGLCPRAELEGNAGDSNMGLIARQMGQHIRKIQGIADRKKVNLVYLNQLRCLLNGTVMMANGQMITVGELKIGDVICVSEKGKTIVTNKVDTTQVNGKKLTLKHRGIFSISNNHLQPVISGGSVIEKMGSDVQIGDFLIQPIIKNSVLSNDIPYINLVDIIEETIDEAASNIKKVTLPKIIDEDLGFLLGCYYSDGCLGEYQGNSTYRISFTENNKDRYELIKNVCNKIFNSSDVSIMANGIGIVLNGSHFVSFFKKLECNRYGRNKVIPKCILRSRESVIKAFIRGAFFDTHGFSSMGFIFTSENFKETQKFASLLYYMGIFVDVRNDRAEGFNRLFFTGEDAINFNKKIGFAEKKKQQYAAKFEANYGSRGKYDIVPLKYGKAIFEKVRKEAEKNIEREVSYRKNYAPIYVCIKNKLNISRIRLIEFLQEKDSHLFEEHITFLTNHRFTEVVKIEKDCFDATDIEVSDDNGLFIADRFITHNSKIGVVFGSPETTTGGNALKFFASARLDTRRIATNKKEGSPESITTRVRVVKNKMAPPLKEAEFDIDFGVGINVTKEIITIAVEKGIVEKSGSWFAYNSDRLGQGVDKATQFLNDNQEIRQEILNKINEVL